MNKEGYHARTANLTGKLDNSKVVKTCMGDQRRYQMLDEDSRYRKGAKNVQVGAMAHKALAALQYLL
jgi:hypothetical protein